MRLSTADGVSFISYLTTCSGTILVNSTLLFHGCIIINADVTNSTIIMLSSEVEMGKEALITKIERLNYEQVKEIKADSQQVHIYIGWQIWYCFSYPIRENIASGALTCMDMDFLDFILAGQVCISNCISASRRPGL